LEIQQNTSLGQQAINDWLDSEGFHPFEFQKECWGHIVFGNSGLLNAPTGSGKTYAIWLGILMRWINANPSLQPDKKGLKFLWITPLRALSKDIHRALNYPIEAMNLPLDIALRTGDTSTNERARQKKHIPDGMLITPESVHLLLAQKGSTEFLKNIECIIIDEWHELIGSKRGVLVELALSKLKSIANNPIIWGISATIGNMELSKEVLFAGEHIHAVDVIAKIDKQLQMTTIMPDEIERFPWAGHLGLKMIEKVKEVIDTANTCLIFTNTRGQSEIWFHQLLDLYPELAGIIALHHGSMDKHLRLWVEESIANGILKVVICTSSLDLGIDFKPVDTVIQVGSPKGVARYLQRAGRSGHGPGELSKIYFLPTHSLELVEAASLRTCVQQGVVEQKIPYILTYDVLVQYLTTLAVGDGFDKESTFVEVQNTFCFQYMTKDEWNRIIRMIVDGGAMGSYDDFKKVEVVDGKYKVLSKKLAMRHRLSIGVIISEAMLNVKYIGGGYVGMIEEYFVSKLKEGDAFTLAGRNLAFVQIKDMTVLVRKTNSKKTIIPSYMGGRMSLSANLGEMLRYTMQDAMTTKDLPIELSFIQPLLVLQNERSHVPMQDEFLVEYIVTEDGFHLFCYPFEGRQIHEIMGSLVAYRIGLLMPITFSIAMNDYGFELVSDQAFDMDSVIVRKLFSSENLIPDVKRSINESEVARRKFRDIACISGMIFQGFPDKMKKSRHLQSSSSLIFDVYKEHEPDNLLYLQAYQEAFEHQVEEARLVACFQRINDSKIVLMKPAKLTPFSFPLKVDSLNRDSMTTEKLEDRVRKMQMNLIKD
jgi:ATP-dependent helicase Lhr and Lhr-like helicase